MSAAPFATLDPARYPLPPEVLAEALSPALVIWEEHVRSNVARVIEAAGGDAGRWRPHVKTTKMPAVWNELVRAGVLAGVRGPRGGYRLAKDRKLITLGDIARVVGALEDASEQGDAPGSESEIGRKVVQPLCRELRAETFERLDAITVEELCRRARGEGVESEAARRLDYSI